MKLVLDTNVWLDLLVFRDPGAAFLNDARYEIFADERGAAELARVMGYPFVLKLLDESGRAQAMAAFASAARMIAVPEITPLPKCQDADDQKFLEVALAAGAQYLVTKDAELLVLDRRKLPFRIVRPAELAGTGLAR